MTTTTTRPTAPGKASKRGKNDSVLSGGLPQVNLLPPEVKAARGLKVVKRWLLITILLVAVLLGLLFAWSLLQRSAADSRLDSAEAETVRLRAEEAKYAEVPLVLNQLDQTKAARELGMSTEVLWKPYFGAISAVLPQDANITTIVMTGGTPMSNPAPPASPLEGPSVGQLAFTGNTLAMPEVAAWIDALDSVPGFADAWVSAAQVTGNDGQSYYTVTGTVQVTDAALAERFAAEATEES